MVKEREKPTPSELTTMYAFHKFVNQKLEEKKQKKEKE